MCFTIDKINCPVPLVAQTDIVCWKILDWPDSLYPRKFTSVIQGFVYKRNHLTKNPTDADDFAGTFGKDWVSIHNAFHSYINLRCNNSYDSGRFVKCIIPKGSLYLINKPMGEYVSNQIIIKGPAKNALKRLFT